MRKLMWFAIGFAGVCALCIYAWMTENLLPMAGGCCVAFLILFLLSRRYSALRPACLLLLGCAAGFCWFQIYHLLYLSRATAMDGQTGEVTIQCTDYSYQTDYGTAVEGILTLDGKHYRVKSYVSGDVEMEPGDLLTAVFRFQVTTPDGGDEPTSHQGKGIFLLAYQQGDGQLEKLATKPIWCSAAVFRNNIKGKILEFFPEDTAGFAAALLLGDRTGIDYETNTSFQVSGISHIIAVSGLHVSILFSLVYVLCLKRRWLVSLVGIPALIFFAAVAGFSPSVTRACIMMILMLLAMLFDREYDGPTELAFAVLVMLIANPLVITSVSFQLSVGCMMGIFLFQKRIYDWMMEKLGKRLHRVAKWFSGSVSMTISAMVITMPLTAYYFGTISLVGVLSNLLTLWIISLIFYGIMLICLAGWLGVGAAGALAGIVSWGIRYVLIVAKMLSSVPLAAVYTRSIYMVGWLVFCYVLLGVFLIFRKKSPGVLICCGILGLFLCVGASWLEPVMDACRMTVLNVGQGQCIILQSQRKTYLVDCGGSDDEETADLAAETLMSMGVFRLDGVVITHYDRDHSGGLPYLLSRIPADALFLPKTGEEQTLLESQEVLENNIIWVDEDVLIAYGNSTLRIYGSVLEDSGNESSLAVLFQAGNCDILVTGDRGSFGERMLLRTSQLPELEILVVGHHGSKYATCEELLDATSPKLAVISVGENHYGHPAQEVLERLAAYGCAVYRTDRDGTITFRR